MGWLEEGGLGGLGGSRGLLERRGEGRGRERRGERGEGEGEVKGG